MRSLNTEIIYMGILKQKENAKKKKRGEKNKKEEVLRGIIPSRGDGSARLIWIPSKIGVVAKFSSKVG